MDRLGVGVQPVVPPCFFNGISAQGTVEPCAATNQARTPLLMCVLGDFPTVRMTRPRREAAGLRVSGTWECGTNPRHMEG